jgi:hypothetical protein
MSEAYESANRKVATIFKKLAGDRAQSLEGAVHAGVVRNLIVRSLAESYPSPVADEIAFHLADWNSDAAFLVALLLFPERFTREEIQAGIIVLLVHVPPHVIAAARLGGIPAEDIFAGTEPVQRSRVANKQSRRTPRTKRRPPPAPRRPRRT